jgi:hypothetical protein
LQEHGARIVVTTDYLLVAAEASIGIEQWVDGGPHDANDIPGFSQAYACPALNGFAEGQFRSTITTHGFPGNEIASLPFE